MFDSESQMVYNRKKKDRCMPKVQTSLRIDEENLKEAREILHSLGMNFSEAVNVFTAMVVRERGLPFDVVLHDYPAVDEAEAREKVARALDGVEKKEGIDAERFFRDLLKS